MSRLFSLRGVIRATVILLSISALSCAAPLNYTRPDGPRYTGCLGNTHFDWNPRTGALSRDARRWPEALGSPAELPVATFNIAFSKHIEEAVTLIGETPALAGADVLLLQEMDERGVRRIASEFGYCWVYYPATVHPRTKRRFGNAVLSRYPFLEDHKVLLPHLGQFGKTLRIATGVTLDVNGTPVRVYSVHLATLMELGPERRRDQARAVVEDAARFSGPVLVGGDLNEYALGNVFAEAGYDWVTHDIGKTTELASLDHFLTRGLEPVPGVSVGKVADIEDASDHLPVWARFELPGGRVSPGKALETSDAVFLGSVLRISYAEHGGTDDPALGPGPGLVRTRFLVEKVWKGALGDTVDVYSSLGPEGVSFLTGLEYLVYAGRRPIPGQPSAVLVTDAYSRTRLGSEAAADLDRLPSPGPDPGEGSKILLREADGGRTRETVPSDAQTAALYGFFRRWLEQSPDPLPDEPRARAILEQAAAVLETGILANHPRENAEALLAGARTAPPDALGLAEPIRIAGVDTLLDGASVLIALEGGDGKPLIVIQRNRIENTEPPSN